MKYVHLVTLKNPVRVRFKPVQTIFVWLVHQQSTLDNQDAKRMREFQSQIIQIPSTHRRHKPNDLIKTFLELKFIIQQTSECSFG